MPSADIAAVVAKVTMVIGIVGLLDLLCLRRRGSAALRHFMWLVAVGASLALPVLSLSLPGYRLEMTVLGTRTVDRLIAAQSPVHPAASAYSRDDDGRTGRLPVSGPADPIALTSSSASRHSSPLDVSSPVGLSAITIGIDSIALWLWAAVAVLIVARVAFEYAAIRQLRSRSRVADDPALLAETEIIRKELGIRRTVSLQLLDESIVPITWGIVRPHILLPASAQVWPAAQRRAVLAHELAHVARHDCLTQTLAAAACAVYWFHPGVWWAAHRLRVEREFACDDHVLAFGTRGVDYAAHLLGIARSACTTATASTPRMSTLAVHMATTSNLEVRMIAAIDSSRRRAVPRGMTRWLLCAAASVLVVPIATLDAVGPAVLERNMVPRMQSSTASSDRQRSTDATSLSGTAGSARSASPTGSSAVGSVATQPPANTSVRNSARGGTWRMRPATPGERIGGNPSVHVLLNTNGINTFVVRQSELVDITSEQMTTGIANARFSLVRDAGTLEFEGTFRDGTGSGGFVVQLERTFGDALEKRGISRPTSSQQFSMALHDVSLELVDELLRLGYRPTASELQRIGLTSAGDVQFLRDLDRLGYRVGSVSTLIEMTNHSVDPQFIERTNTAEGRKLTIAELLNRRRSGYDRQSRGASGGGGTATSGSGTSSAGRMSTGATAGSGAGGGGHASVAAATRTGNTPVDGRFVAQRVGGGIQFEVFWSDGTNWRRTFPEHELRELSPAVNSVGRTVMGASIGNGPGQFQVEGSGENGRAEGSLRFVPNRAFADSLRTLGVSGTESIDEHDLKNMLWGGVTAASVRELTAIGYTNISVGELVGLGIYGVNVAFARAMRDAKVEESETLGGVASLRHSGVSAEYVGMLAALGYTGLTGDDVRALMRARITADVIRTQSRKLTVDELLQLRRR